MSLPGFGRFSICLAPMSVLTLASSVWSICPVAETSTVSEALPKASLILAAAVCPKLTSTFWETFLKPLWVTVTVYEPGFNSAKEYRPNAFVFVVRLKLVAGSVSVTVALGTTAPLGSVTVPFKPPVTIDWETKLVGSSNKIIATATRENALRIYVLSILILGGAGKSEMSRWNLFTGFMGQNLFSS